jgi:hypothetical protein
MYADLPISKLVLALPLQLQQSAEPARESICRRLHFGSGVTLLNRIQFLHRCIINPGKSALLSERSRWSHRAQAETVGDAV